MRYIKPLLLIFLFLFLTGSASAFSLSMRDDPYKYLNKSDEAYFNFTSDEAFVERNVYANGELIYTSSGSWSAHGNNYFHMATVESKFPDDEGLYNVTLICRNAGGAYSTPLEWHLRVKKVMATTPIDPIEGGNYSTVEDAIMEKNLTKVGSGITGFYTDRMGNFFYLILLLIPFVGMYIETRKLTLVSTTLLILGSVLIFFLPSGVLPYVTIIIWLALGSILYLKIAKEG